VSLCLGGSNFLFPVSPPFALGLRDAIGNTRHAAGLRSIVPSKV
jgi:hypothetical protein